MYTGGGYSGMKGFVPVLIEICTAQGRGGRKEIPRSLYINANIRDAHNQCDSSLLNENHSDSLIRELPHFYRARGTTCSPEKWDTRPCKNRAKGGKEGKGE